MATAIHPAKTITVERTEVLKSGVKNGKAWTLYQVHGRDEAGFALRSVKSFDSLPVGEVAVFLETDQRDIGWYVAKLVRPNRERQSPGTSRDTTALEQRVARLEAQMRAIINNSEVPLP